jgi:transcription termination/antitermination protein NusG
VEWITFSTLPLSNLFKFVPKQTAKFGRNWYAIHTYSGYEDSVARNLRQRIESFNMSSKIFNVLVPIERKIKIKRGKREVVEEKVYPGYVLVDMVVDDDSWYVVRNTPRVTGFVGSGNTPVPVSKEEIDEINSRMGVKEPQYKIDINPGDTVKINDGPFKEFDARVSEVDDKKGRVKVLVSLFGRETPVDLDFLQVKKI